MLVEQCTQADGERLVSDLEDGSQLSLGERARVTAEHVQDLLAKVGIPRQHGWGLDM